MLYVTPCSRVIDPDFGVGCHIFYEGCHFFFLCALIQNSLHPVKKSHLFRGHVDPLFRCPRSKNGIK